MWSQLLVLSVVMSPALGMCFGVPHVQQSVDCLPPRVYYAPLCVCLEPQHQSRIHKLSLLRKLPLLGKNMIHDGNSAYKSREEGNRFRLAASLPDTPGYAFGSSVSETSDPLAVIFPAGMMSSLPVISNHLPRSWRVRGAPTNTWARNSFTGGQIPTIKSAMKSPSPNDLGTLTTMEKLKMMRDSWKKRSLSKAKSMMATPTKLASKFYAYSRKAISPEVSRSSYQSPGGSLYGIIGKTKISPKPLSIIVSPLKQADMSEQTQRHLNPKTPAGRRNNYFTRSAMRLKAARLALKANQQ